MNCRETERLLDTFFDGELDGRLMRDAALHITRCQTCERELQDRERLHDLLAETIGEDVREIVPGRVWAAVEAAAEAVEEESAFRIAAVTSSVRGVLLGSRWGRRRARASRGRASPAGRSRLAGSLPLAGLSALAAGVVVMLLATDQEVGEAPAPATRVARSSVATQASAIAPAVATVANRERRDSARADQRIGSRQVQIDSLEYSGKAMALWREPASETTIIWIGDSDPRIAKPAR